MPHKNGNIQTFARSNRADVLLIYVFIHCLRNKKAARCSACQENECYQQLDLDEKLDPLCETKQLGLFQSPEIKPSISGLMTTLHDTIIRFGGYSATFLRHSKLKYSIHAHTRESDKCSRRFIKAVNFT
jgi:hypothetical protein